MTDTHRLGRRGEALRRAVLDATIDQIADHGIEAATIQAVAGRAGVHETSVYRRWKTRENLVLDALIDKTSRDIPVPDSGSLRGDLIALARSAAAFVQSPVGYAFLQAGVNAPRVQSGQLRAFWSARREAMSVVVQRAKQRGELDYDTDDQLMFEALVAPLHFRILLSRQSVDTDLPERLADLVLRGVGAH